MTYSCRRGINKGSEVVSKGWSSGNERGTDGNNTIKKNKKTPTKPDHINMQ